MLTTSLRYCDINCYRLEAKLPEDETKTQSDKIQKLTDESIKKIDDALAAKEKEIMQV